MKYSSYHTMAALLTAAAVITGTVSACDTEEFRKIDDDIDLCPDDPNKTKPGICGCGKADIIDALTGVYTCKYNVIDFCPNDPLKTLPGICGCGVADTKGSDGLPLCQTQNIDLCPFDPLKTLPGICGCGVSDEINSETGVPSCLDTKIDMCPDDHLKTVPGVCGCNTPDTLDPLTGIPKCISEDIDFCPNDPDKTKPGICGCGIPDTDIDNDGYLDCVDECPEDSGKSEPGTCGCGIPDSPEKISDDDRDGVPNCLDPCPDVAEKFTVDGCECTAVLTTMENNEFCALMIKNAEDFVKFRDDWNSGFYKDYIVNDEILAFKLVNDINLGSVLSSSQAAQWQGIGTEELPFNAVFIGDGHTVSASHKTDYSEQQLKLGNPELSDIALFSYTDNAHIQSLNTELMFVGNSYVAALIAHAEKTVLNDIHVSTEINAADTGAGIAAEINNSTVKNMTVKGKIDVRSNFAGGIAAIANSLYLSQSESNCSVNGGKYTGGIVGSIDSDSQLIDLYASGPVSGKSMTGGLIGRFGRNSTITNAYTTAAVTCYEPPCATLIAHVEESTSLRNIYTTGKINDEIPQPEIPGEPVSPEIPGSPVPGNPDEISSQIDTAVVIASFKTRDTKMSNVYYWLDPAAEATADTSGMTGINKLTSFDYKRLRPYTLDTNESLLDVLNSALNCTSGVCTIAGTNCTKWTAGIFTIIPEDSSGSAMSVTIPRLVFSNNFKSL